MQRDYAHYHVALKLVLKKGDLLLLLKSPRGYLDLPGGRIDDIEDNTPLTEILAREVREELGEDIKYKLGKPAFQFRRFFPNKGWKIFLTAYEADYISGEVQISDEHDSFEWINPKEYDFKLEQFVNEEEYLAFVEYFGKLN